MRLPRRSLATRPLTNGERAMVRPMFGEALRYDAVRLHRGRWWPLQPRNVVMAPRGDIWFHPDGGLWRDDFTVAPARLQALLVHELAHVWQHQQGLTLLLRRHPFCRYDYGLEPGKPLRRYDVEQQAMIIEHAFTARQGGQPDSRLEALLRDAGLGAPQSGSAREG